MPADLVELEEALKSFWEDVLRAFVNLEVEIHALQEALLEGQVVSGKRLDELRRNAKNSQHKFQDRYARTIAPAHELR